MTAPSRHAAAVLELGIQLSPQLPVELEVRPAVDVDALPATGRLPDLVIVTPSSDVVVAIEVGSPATVRTDTEYAAAGVPHLWLIDQGPPVTATVHALVDGRYRETLRADGVFMVEEPCPLWVDLTALSADPG